MEKPNYSSKGKLFNSKVLEALSRTHPAVIYAIYIPFCGYLLYYFYTNIEPNALKMAGLFFAGAFFWTFMEYMMHRYIFHFINESEWSKKFHYVVHGIHHDHPNDKERLIMPPLPSVVVAAFFFIVFKLIFGNYVFAFLPGFIIGYLLYAFIHYSIHRFKPPTGLKWLWKHHNVHHYREPDRAFGVSNTFWDHIFRTMPTKKGQAAN